MRPAIVLALMPHLAAWGKTPDQRRARRGGHQRRARSASTSSAQMGVLYHGLEVLGGGAILAASSSARSRVFIIERKFVKAAGVRRWPARC